MNIPFNYRSRLWFQQLQSNTDFGLLHSKLEQLQFTIGIGLPKNKSKIFTITVRGSKVNCEMVVEDKSHRRGGHSDGGRMANPEDFDTHA